MTCVRERYRELVSRGFHGLFLVPLVFAFAVGFGGVLNGFRSTSSRFLVVFEPVIIGLVTTFLGSATCVSPTEVSILRLILSSF